MPISVITSKGQTTIPKTVRESLQLKPKDKLLFVIEGRTAIIRPLHGSIRGLKGAFKLPAWEKKPLDFKKLRREFEQGMADHVVSEMQ